MDWTFAFNQTETGIPQNVLSPCKLCNLLFLWLVASFLNTVLQVTVKELAVSTWYKRLVCGVLLGFEVPANLFVAAACRLSTDCKLGFSRTWQEDGENYIMRTKIALFWVVASCSLVDVYRRFRGPCCLHHQSPWWWRQQGPLKRW
jgi:hypothetical protein